MTMTTVGLDLDEGMRLSRPWGFIGPGMFSRGLTFVLYDLVALVQLEVLWAKGTV